MTTHDKEIVSALRVALVDQIGRDRYDVWFGTDTHLALRGDRLIVSVPSRFKLDWMRNNFRRVLETLGNELVRSSLAVEFRLDPTLGGDSATQNARGCSKPQPRTAASKTAPAANTRKRRFARLESFVGGNGNCVASAAAATVSRTPGEVSPLFIHGPHGVGKTHLLEGICRAARQQGTASRQVYLTAEQFTSYFLEAVHGKGTPNFRHKYRGASLLAIDDVQFFVGKRATRQELKHTIDAFSRDGRQLVFAADRPPHELAELGPELVARFSSGLVCGIAPPDAATRRGILRGLAEQLNMSVPDDILDWLAARIDGDSRLLRGALHRIWATSKAWNRPIDRQLVQEAVGDIFRTPSRPVELGDIDRVVCEFFGLDPKKLRSNGKSRSVAYPRALAMWLARKHTRAALSEISQHFGRRSHSTVISAQRKVAGWMANGDAIDLTGAPCRVEEAIGNIERKLQGG